MKRFALNLTCLSLMSAAVVAEDIQIYSNINDRPDPNVIFVMDTSNSMNRDAISGLLEFGRPGQASHVGTQTTPFRSRFSVAQDALNTALTSIADDDDRNINVAIMRFNVSDGGYVIEEMQSLQDNISELNSAVDLLSATDGHTPLTETMFEAFSYFRGDEVTFGRSSSSPNNNLISVENHRNFQLLSVPESRNGSFYRSPATEQCHGDHIAANRFPFLGRG